MDDAVGPLVLRNADAQTIKRAAMEQGMDSLRDDGARKVLSRADERRGGPRRDAGRRRGRGHGAPIGAVAGGE